MACETRGHELHGAGKLVRMALPCREGSVLGSSVARGDNRAFDSVDPLELRLVLADLLMQAGNQSAYFVGLIGTATYTLGADAYMVALVVISQGLIYTIGGATMGVVIDRIGPRRALVGGLSGLAGAALIAAFIPLDFRILLAMGMLVGFFTGSCTTAISAFPPFIVIGRDELKRANALVDTATHIAIILGPLMGGLISAAFSSQLVYAFTAICAAGGAYVAWGIEERYTPMGDEEADLESDAGSTGNLVTDFIDGLRHTFASPDLKLLFTIAFLGFFAYGAFDSLESLFYRDVLKVTVSWMGWLSAASGFGSVIGSITLMRIPTERVNVRLLVFMLFITGVGAMVYVGTSNVEIAAIGQIICGFGFGLLMPIQHMLVQESCDLGYIGRVSSIMRIGLNGAGVIPLLFAPYLASIFGVQTVLFVASTFSCAMGMFYIATVKGGR